MLITRIPEFFKWETADAKKESGSFKCSIISQHNIKSKYFDFETSSIVRTSKSAFVKGLSSLAFNIVGVSMSIPNTSLPWLASGIDMFPTPQPTSIILRERPNFFWSFSASSIVNLRRLKWTWVLKLLNLKCCSYLFETFMLFNPLKSFSNRNILN